MRSGFTLLELMISVVLISLMVFFIARGEWVLRIAADQMQKEGLNQQARQGVSDLLVRDLLQAQKVRILAGRNYDQLFLGSTAHSLYGRAQAEVVYLISKPDRALMRLESASSLVLPLSSNRQIPVHHLSVLPDLQAFKVHLFRDEEKQGRCSVLLYLQRGEGEPLLLELGLLNHNACQVQ